MFMGVKCLVFESAELGVSTGYFPILYRSGDVDGVDLDGDLDTYNLVRAVVFYHAVRANGKLERRASHIM